MSCAGAIVAEVFNGRDNPIKIVLRRDGAPLVDLSGVTRVTVRMDATTLIDSDAQAGVITWTDQVVRHGVTTDVLKLKLGHQGLAVGSYTAQVVLFDSTYPNGLRLESDLLIEVKA